MTRPDHRHIPFRLDAITGITTDMRARRSALALTERGARGSGNLSP